MKTTFKIKAILSLLLLNCFVVSANKIYSSEVAIIEMTKKTSAEELFLEIFFLKNQTNNPALPAFIVTEIKNFQNLSDDKKAVVQKRIDYVFNYIKTNHPEYFENLKRAVTSKNHYSIKSSVIEGGKFVNDAMDSYKILSPRESGLVIYGEPLGIVICYILPLPPAYINAGFTIDIYVDIIASTF